MPHDARAGPELDEESKMSNRDKILSMLSTAPGLTARELSDRLPTKASNIRKALPKMVRDGQIRRIGRPNRYVIA